MGAISDGTLQGDLLIKGGGDPFLTEDYFRNMLKTLQRRGVARISGDLVIDAGLFDPSVSTEPLIDDETNRSYNVLPYPLMVNFQTVNFFFYPHSNGRDVVIKADPELPNLTIVNQLQLDNAACAGFQRGVSFREDPADTNGVIFAGYLGSFLMAGTYLAIGAAVSAATTNQVIAFVLAVAVCFLFTAAGAPLVMEALSGWAPAPLVEAVASFSFLSHFSAITLGVIDLRDAIFFLSLMALFLFANMLIVESGKGG